MSEQKPVYRVGLTNEDLRGNAKGNIPYNQIVYMERLERVMTLLDGLAKEVREVCEGAPEASSEDLGFLIIALNEAVKKLSWANIERKARAMREEVRCARRTRRQSSRTEQNDFPF